MKENFNISEAINEISHDKDIDKELVIKAFEEAMTISAKKKYEQYDNIEARYEEDESIRLFYYKTVVESVDDKVNEISLKEAQSIDSQSQLEDEIEYEIDRHEFANVIAQTVRQTFFQKLGECENHLLKEKYQDKVKKIVFGSVGQVNRNRCIVNLKRNVSAVLDYKSQIPNEKLVPGEPVKALLTEIATDGTKTILLISRAHSEFLIKLFELEIPEIEDNTIEILAVARDPGRRAKVAVRSNNSDVDPVGSCVGRGGERIQSIVNELNGEKIDVVRWSNDLKKFISDSLVPAEINNIELDTENNVANVFVDMQNLALAIGKKGQNVKLASKLTQFELNIRTLEEEGKEEEDKEDNMPDLQLFSEESVDNSNSADKAALKVEEQSKNESAVDNSNSADKADLKVEEQSKNESAVDNSNSADKADLKVEEQSKNESAVDNSNSADKADLKVEEQSKNESAVDNSNSADKADLKVEEQSKNESAVDNPESSEKLPSDKSKKQSNLD